MKTDPTASVTSSSSRHSRTSASGFVSPGSTLPPGNSHKRPLALCGGRWQIMKRSPSQMRPATTSTAFGSIVKHQPFPYRL